MILVPLFRQRPSVVKIVFIYAQTSAKYRKQLRKMHAIFDLPMNEKTKKICKKYKQNSSLIDTSIFISKLSCNIDFVMISRNGKDVLRYHLRNHACEIVCIEAENSRLKEAPVYARNDSFRWLRPGGVLFAEI